MGPHLCISCEPWAGCALRARAGRQVAGSAPRLPKHLCGSGTTASVEHYYKCWELNLELNRR